MGTAQSDAQILKGLLDAMVLRVLSEGDNYGYGILQQVAHQLDGETGVLRQTTLYPLLHRLDAKGLVETYWKPGSRGTDRKYYRLTKAGRTYLKDRIADWKRVAQILDRTIFSK